MQGNHNLKMFEDSPIRTAWDEISPLLMLLER